MENLHAAVINFKGIFDGLNSTMSDYLKRRDALDEFMVFRNELVKLLSLSSTVASNAAAAHDKQTNTFAKCIALKRDNSYKSWASIASNTPIPEVLPLPVAHGVVVGGAALTYCATTMEFQLRLPGLMLRGNIGQTDEVISTKPCAFQDKCTNRGRGCKFWHDIKICGGAGGGSSGSSEIMNFSGKSWARQRISAASIDTDIASMSAADIIMFERQCLHDLLCCIVIQKKRPTKDI